MNKCFIASVSTTFSNYRGMINIEIILYTLCKQDISFFQVKIRNDIVYGTNCYKYSITVEPRSFEYHFSERLIIRTMQSKGVFTCTV